MGAMPGEEMRDLLVSLASKKEGKGKKVKDILTILDRFIPEPVAQESVSDLLIDYVFNLCLAMAKHALLPEAAGDPATICYKAVFQTFRLEESEARALSRLAIAAAREADRERDPLSKSQQVNEDYCYLCGGEFLNSAEEKTSVDHVWPKRAAGTKKKSNLFRCHERCEIPKWDTLGAGDVASLRFAFKESHPLLTDPVESDWTDSSTDEKGKLLRLLRDMRFAQLRVGIAARQQYKCAECEKSFLNETRGFRISKREDDVPWAYTNTIAVCDSCHLKRKEYHA